MPQDHVGPIENPGVHTAGEADKETKGSTIAQRILLGVLGTFFVTVIAGILVAFLAFIWFNLAALPAQLDADRKLFQERFDAGQALWEERFAAERVLFKEQLNNAEKRSEERFEAARKRSDERFEAARKLSEESAANTQKWLDDTRAEIKELVNLLYETRDSARENGIRLEILEKSRDGIQ